MADLPDTSSANASPAASAPLPERIGPYRIERRLGHGAFAEVYLARDPDSDAPLALKVLRSELDPTIARQVRARFLFEERIANAVGDPRIVKVHATSAPDEQPCYLAMEYVNGESFSESLRRRRGRQSSVRAVHLFELARLGHEVARAISAAHARGIVHRDLKPDNVLVTHRTESAAPSIKIVDFGIAKAPIELLAGMRAATFTPHHTEFGTVMGSPPYMAPEQGGAAHSVTGRADVFALGVMLTITALGLDHEVLEANRTSFVPEDFERLLDQGPPLPSEWRDLLLRMVERDPDRRPDMSTVALELQRLAQPDAELAEAVHGWVTRNKQPSRKHLIELLRSSEDEAKLTEDERAFLRLAPARALESRGAWGSRVLVSLCLAASVGLALGWAKEHERHAYYKARTRAERQDAARSQSELQRKFAAQAETNQVLLARGNVEPPRSAPLPAAREEMSKDLRSDARLAQCRSASAELAECVALRERADKQAASLATRFEQLGRELESQKREVESQKRELDERASAEARCRRELEIRVSESTESSSRLRLCNDSLRARPTLPPLGPALSPEREPSTAEAP